jgi:hypothetical protein
MLTDQKIMRPMPKKKFKFSNHKTKVNAFDRDEFF